MIREARAVGQSQMSEDTIISCNKLLLPNTDISFSICFYLSMEDISIFKKILKRARHAEVFEHILDNEILSRENIFEE